MKLILNMENTGRSDYMRYEIKGGMMPVVEIILEAGESINCEKGAMVWMSPNMQMQTSGGGVGKMFTRAISGESMFRNTYTAQGGPGLIAFGSSFVGNIMAVEIGPGQGDHLSEVSIPCIDTGNQSGDSFSKEDSRWVLRR